MPRRRTSLRFFPVQGGGQYSNDWGNARSGGRTHQGTDIFAPLGTPIVAVESGYITKMGPSKIGGNRIWLNGRFYYAHLSRFAKGLSVGDKVKAGQVIGYVGTTGDAKGTSPHLHFGFSPNRSQGASWKNPYNLLREVEGTSPPMEDVGGLPEPPQSATGPLPPEAGPQPAPLELAPPPGAPEMPSIEGGYPGEVPHTGIRELSPAARWQTLADLPFSSIETQEWAQRLRRYSVTDNG